MPATPGTHNADAPPRPAAARRFLALLGAGIALLAAAPLTAQDAAGRKTGV
jgi:hypothetical protein